MALRSVLTTYSVHLRCAGLYTSKLSPSGLYPLVRTLATSNPQADSSSSVSNGSELGFDNVSSSNYRVLTGLILSRPPVVTPELTPFEKAFYYYQSELKKRLMWTFTSWFYYPKGALAEKEFNAVQPKLESKSGKVAKSDILLNRDRGSKQTVVFPERDVERESEESAKIYAKIVPASRVTEADKKNDVHSLERKLDRSLYLLVTANGKSNWQFPTAEVLPSESLTTAAERMLTSMGGENMNTWIISNSPAVFHKDESNGADNSFVGSKAFYLRSRIFAGKFVPQEGSGIKDFAWVTKNEIEDYVDPEYWNKIKGALSSQ
ncbi:39S mitochondrial ribosomal protein L46-domain-containing protein [Dipodascopsis uninucleata]